ncbi:hypothetical protein N752_29930 [Desulforamulus aquiferis]|nr:hypothetical protein [Desulforamulus aquiferis]RYD01523.1 hypothetical protein N752_29930 [Desulforamulus aquiferis]
MIQYPSPLQAQQLTDRIINLKLSQYYWTLLATVIEEYPANVYSTNCTNIEKANDLVQRALQKGSFYELENEINKLEEQKILPMAESQSLDIQLAINFGKMFQELFQCLEQEYFDITDISEEQSDVTDFEDKIKNRAKFSQDMWYNALICKSENSVLRKRQIVPTWSTILLYEILYRKVASGKGGFLMTRAERHNVWLGLLNIRPVARV